MAENDVSSSVELVNSVLLNKREFLLRKGFEQGTDQEEFVEVLDWLFGD